MELIIFVVAFGALWIARTDRDRLDDLNARISTLEYQRDLSAIAHNAVRRDLETIGDGQQLQKDSENA